VAPFVEIARTASGGRPTFFPNYVKDRGGACCKEMNLTAYPQFTPKDAACAQVTVPLQHTLLTLYCYEFARIAIQ
jgi:hypothetical protein